MPPLGSSWMPAVVPAVVVVVVVVVVVPCEPCCSCRVVSLDAAPEYWAAVDVAAPLCGLVASSSTFSEAIACSCVAFSSTLPEQQQSYQVNETGSTAEVSGRFTFYANRSTAPIGCDKSWALVASCSKIVHGVIVMIVSGMWGWLLVEYGNGNR